MFPAPAPTSQELLEQIVLILDRVVAGELQIYALNIEQPPPEVMEVSFVGGHSQSMVIQQHPLTVTFVVGK